MNPARIIKLIGYARLLLAGSSIYGAMQCFAHAAVFERHYLSHHHDQPGQQKPATGDARDYCNGLAADRENGGKNAT